MDDRQRTMTDNRQRVITIAHPERMSSTMFGSLSVKNLSVKIFCLTDHSHEVSNFFLGFFF